MRLNFNIFFKIYLQVNRLQQIIKYHIKPTLKITEMLTFEKIRYLYDFSGYFKIRAQKKYNY